MLIEILAHHARWSKDHIAVIAPDGEQLTFAQTHAAIVSVAEALACDFPQLLTNHPVGVAMANRYSHFLLTLALEYLGLATMAFVLPLDSGVEHALLQCRALIADQVIAGHVGRHILLDRAWLRDATGRSHNTGLAPARWHNHQLASLIVTSGSTGAAKCIRLSYQARSLRERNRAWRYGFSPDTKYLLGLPISVSNVAISARAVLRSGGTVIFADQGALDQLFHGITHTTLLPSHVRAILDALPHDYRHPEKIRLLSIGAPLGSDLRQRAEQMLNAEVESNYGCNESGGCGLIDRDGVGHVFPDTDVKVMDQEQREMAAGTAGVIWVRSDEIADGYTDAILTQAQFVDGWFVTGDIGVMLDRRRFRLLGRVDALINLGGHKVAPESFEASLLSLGLAQDLAVTALLLADGIEQICVCLANPLLDNAELLTRLRHVFGANTGNIAVIFVDQILRNATGKVQRQQMRELAATRIAEQRHS